MLSIPGLAAQATKTNPLFRQNQKQTLPNTVGSTSEQAIRSAHGAVLPTNRQFKGFLKAGEHSEERKGGSAHGLFGDDAELAAGVAAAAGELERGVARGHAAAEDNVDERAPHPVGFSSRP